MSAAPWVLLGVILLLVCSYFWVSRKAKQKQTSIPEVIVDHYADHHTRCRWIVVVSIGVVVVASWVGLILAAIIVPRTPRYKTAVFAWQIVYYILQLFYVPLMLARTKTHFHVCAVVLAVAGAAQTASVVYAAKWAAEDHAAVAVVVLLSFQAAWSVIFDFVIYSVMPMCGFNLGWGVQMPYDSDETLGDMLQFRLMLA